MMKPIVKKIERIPSSYKEDLRSLYDRFYKAEVKSESTSSHWDLYSEYFHVGYIDENTLKIRGEGFGDFEVNSLKNKIKNIPSSFYLRNLTRKLNPKLYKAAQKTSFLANRLLSFDCLKQALSIEKMVSLGVNFSGKKVCIIGDGYGFMGLFLKSLYPDLKIVSVNLGKTLFFDYLYTATSAEEYSLSLADSQQDTDFTFVCAESYEESNIKDIDIFINIASMQEMDLLTVRNYMNWIRSQLSETVYFYCCNRVSKTLPDGSEINFEEYGWEDRDSVLLDDLCSWYQEFPINRPPFSQKFDGLIKHRLVKISGKS